MRDTIWYPSLLRIYYEDNYPQIWDMHHPITEQTFMGRAMVQVHTYTDYVYVDLIKKKHYEKSVFTVDSKSRPNFIIYYIQR